VIITVKDKSCLSDYQTVTFTVNPIHENDGKDMTIDKLTIMVAILVIISILSLIVVVMKLRIKVST